MLSKNLKSLPLLLWKVLVFSLSQNHVATFAWEMRYSYWRRNAEICDMAFSERANQHFTTRIPSIKTMLTCLYRAERIFILRYWQTLTRRWFAFPPLPRFWFLCFCIMLFLFCVRFALFSVLFFLLLKSLLCFCLVVADSDWLKLDGAYVGLLWGTFGGSRISHVIYDML